MEKKKGAGGLWKLKFKYMDFPSHLAQLAAKC